MIRSRQAIDPLVFRHSTLLHCCRKFLKKKKKHTYTYTPRRERLHKSSYISYISYIHYFGSMTTSKKRNTPSTPAKRQQILSNYVKKNTNPAPPNKKVDGKSTPSRFKNTTTQGDAGRGPSPPDTNPYQVLGDDYEDNEDFSGYRSGDSSSSASSSSHGKQVDKDSASPAAEARNETLESLERSEALNDTSVITDSSEASTSRMEISSQVEHDQDTVPHAATRQQNGEEVVQEHSPTPTDDTATPQNSNVTDVDQDDVSANQPKATSPRRPTTATPQGILRNSDASPPLTVPSVRQSGASRRLDKDIKLKRGMMRSHVHRYDLSLTVKKQRNDDAEEALVHKLLQRFFEILSSVDSSIIIPPYFEVDRNNRALTDVSKDYPVSSLDSYMALRTYFSRLNSRNETTGKVYCSLILATSLPFKDLMREVQSSLRNSEMGLYPRASDHENAADVGWLLYSVRQQDEERLSWLLSSLIGETVGVKWKLIRTTDGFQKRDTNDSTPPVKVSAMHIEGPLDRAHDIRKKLSQWYSSSSKVFPDGTKMRLIPPFSTILARDNKIKFATLVARQEALNRRLAYTTTWEFASNLLIDKPHPVSGVTFRQLILQIHSSKYPGVSVFHTVDRSWRDENGVTFTFVPEHDSDGRMYVAGLLPYLRSVDEWYLSLFSEDARNRHKNSIWDPQSKQVFSADELGMGDNIYEDDELNCSEEPTASRPVSNENPDIETVIPDVQITGVRPVLFSDSDSVSTFQSMARSRGSRHTGRGGGRLTEGSTTSTSRRQVVTFASSTQVPNTASSPSSIPMSISQDDGSVSRMSDTASRLSAFESHFQAVSADLSSTLAQQGLLLQSILKHLDISNPPSGIATPEAVNRQSSVTQSQANHLSQASDAGGTSSSAGQGS